MYKGYSLTEETEDYLVSFGLKNAIYTIRAEDLKGDLFGKLLHCPFQVRVPLVTSVLQFQKAKFFAFPFRYELVIDGIVVVCASFELLYLVSSDITM